MPALNVAVVGSGISGLSAAWLLSQRHNVVMFEADARAGGHSNTVSVATSQGPVAVDTGFIVSNTWTYPNFTALMDYLDQPMVDTQMSFAVSMDGGRCEYSGNNLTTLLGRPRQWFDPSHWSMMRDLYRFYTTAERVAPKVALDVTLGQFLQREGYGESFIRRHILPMAGAIWSATPDEIAAYPFRSFVAFFTNHKLFILGQRPNWRTVKGGSQSYVNRLIADARFTLALNTPIESIQRHASGAVVQHSGGRKDSFDHVVLATHADQALALLADPSPLERDLLSNFKTSANKVFLHRDASLMPKTRRFWSAWNYCGHSGKRETSLSVTYWMNALQKLESPEQHFVSLNPHEAPKPELTDATLYYRHPVFSPEVLSAQRQLWALQGKQRTWFCGAWFGAGFHEDGLQAGLAVAEQLGDVRRPWVVDNESSRIHLEPRHALPPALPLEAAE